MPYSGRWWLGLAEASLVSDFSRGNRRLGRVPKRAGLLTSSYAAFMGRR